jgi:hypothetical protein
VSLALLVVLVCVAVVVLFALVMVGLAVRSARDDEPATLEGGRSHMRGKR